MCVYFEEKGEWGSDEILMKLGLCWWFGGVRCRVWGVFFLYYVEEVFVLEF